MAGNSTGTTSCGTNNPNYYDLISTTVPNVYVVGAVGDRQAQIVRIVHISDTHDRHDDCMSRIPYGHILVHSGDFGNYSLSRHFFKDRDFRRQIDSMNTFFGKLPHEYKVFVAGNHDSCFDRYTTEEVQSQLTSAIYLQDSECTLYGLKFYGTPWSRLRNGCFARSFSREWDYVRSRWSSIPSDTDVVVSHMPPWNPDLYSDIAKRVQPTLHLFGHEHANYGIKWKDNVLFSNAAMAPHQVNLQRRHTSRSTGASYGLSGGYGSGSSSSRRDYSSWGSGGGPGNSGQRRPIVIDVYVKSTDFHCVLPPAYTRCQSNLRTYSESDDGDEMANGDNCQTKSAQEGNSPPSKLTSPSIDPILKKTLTTSQSNPVVLSSSSSSKCTIS